MTLEGTVSHSFLAPILIIIQLIFLEGILSIDNAAVLGVMVSVLPADKYARFKFFRNFDPVLHWLGEGMGYTNELVIWMFKTPLVMLGLFFAPFRRQFAAESQPTDQPHFPVIQD